MSSISINLPADIDVRFMSGWHSLLKLSTAPIPGFYDHDSGIGRGVVLKVMSFKGMHYDGVTLSKNVHRTITVHEHQLTLQKRQYPVHIQ